MALFGKESDADRERADAWAAWAQRQDVYALASLALGIFSLIEFGVLGIFGVAGIVLGAMALKNLKKPDPPRPRGRGMAWTGIILSIVSLMMAAMLYAWPIFQS
jgi:hypothetical protein